MDECGKGKEMKDKTKQDAERIKAYLEDHKCSDVVAIDVSGECTWTECFVIGTVTSAGHLRGVVHQIWDEINSLGLTVNNRHKSPEISGWELIDCGDIVIHLMSSELREFYNLEKLWKASENLI